MTRIGKAAVFWMLLPLLLTGCWDIKNIQDINYLTCVGFDYIDNQYLVYVQMIDFSSVAKTEQGKPTRPIPVWVGTGKGETVIGAFNDLYRTSQLSIFYGQINSVVLGENMMKRGLKDVQEVLDRYYEFRYIPWFFGTKQPIEQLFAITPFFNLSPLMSMLHQPQEIYKQQSLVAPLTMREFVVNVREPGNSTLVPSLSITDQNWRSNDKPKPMLTLDGIFVFQGEKYQGWMDWKKVLGLRWAEPKTQRSPIIIRSGGKPQIAVSLGYPKFKIIPEIREDQISFNMQVKVSGYISEILQPMSESALEQKVAAQIQTEIKETYEEGLKIKADVFSLGHALYRQKNREWKNLREQGGLNLTSDSLKNIQVEVKLNHSGKLKY